MSWFICGLLALAMWGLWGFFPKIATTHMNPKSVQIFHTIGNVIVSLAILVSINFKVNAHPKGITFGILAGMCATVGSLFFMYGISKGKASVIVPMTALYPIITMALSFLILKETLSMKHLLGAVFALIAIVLFSA